MHLWTLAQIGEHLCHCRKLLASAGMEHREPLRTVHRATTCSDTWHERNGGQIWAGKAPRLQEELIFCHSNGNRAEGVTIARNVSEHLGKKQTKTQRQIRQPKPTLNLHIWTVENANTLPLASLSFHCPLIHLRHPGQVLGQGLHAAISSAWNILPIVSKGLLSSNPSSVFSVFGKPAWVSTRGDSKCHRSRCWRWESWWVILRVWICQQNAGSSHISDSIHWRAAFGNSWVALTPGTEGPQYPYLFKSSLRKYPDKLLNTGF